MQAAFVEALSPYIAAQGDLTYVKGFEQGYQAGKARSLGSQIPTCAL